MKIPLPPHSGGMTVVHQHQDHVTLRGGPYRVMERHLLLRWQGWGKFTLGEGLRHEAMSQRCDPALVTFDSGAGRSHDCLCTGQSAEMRLRLWVFHQDITICTLRKDATQISECSHLFLLSPSVSPAGSSPGLSVSLILRSPQSSLTSLEWIFSDFFFPLYSSLPPKPSFSLD